MIAGVFEERHLHFTPGTKHEYSNTGYIFLAQVVENVSGTSFADFVKKEIFYTLRMHNSFDSDGLARMEVAVSGYHKNENNVFSPVFSPWGVMGAGLVHSSAGD
ncbi:beta-lactamase family protein [Kosakonia sp. S58]|uniref:serine hydrolase n=1 Tax=Kosakonia sp. S58 TaxID=2767457 RepID=UPI0019032A21|nr:beta-lactamase family protein [Kosakonia sp. S57]MBK0086643.1 beta-lactamase family protein [Kosakonia sp. S58]